MTEFFIPYGKPILLILFVMLVSACGGGGGGSTDNRVDYTITSPSDSGAFPAGLTLTSNLYVDGSLTPTQTKNVDLLDTSVSFDFKILPGDHTFKVIFVMDNDPDYGGPFEVANATSSIVTVTDSAGQSYDFNSGQFLYPDNDNDGLVNLTELHNSNRTDPNDATCIVGSSLMGSCILG